MTCRWIIFSLLALVAMPAGNVVQRVRADSIGPQRGNANLILGGSNSHRDAFVWTANASTTAFCGDGVTDTAAGEECDPGPGTCIGGSDAGSSCTADGQCDQTNGVCLDGVNAERACGGDSDCPNSSCVHCKAFGGNGCAANCTTESAVTITLVPGQNPNGDVTLLASGTSGIVLHADGMFDYAIVFPAGVARQLLIGKEKNGKIPGVLKRETNQTAAVEVLGGTACLCVRPIVQMTCGGTLWEKNGLPSTDCSPGYTAGDSVCADGAKPCTRVYGPDNIGEGEVGCESLDGVNTLRTQVSTGTTGSPPEPLLTTLSGTGGVGSAVIFATTEVGFTLGPCFKGNGDPAIYGDDHQFCTQDDPFTTPDPTMTGRNVLPQVLTTGTASASVTNAKDSGNTIGACAAGANTLGCSTDADCPDECTSNRTCGLEPSRTCTGNADCTTVSACIPVPLTGTPLASCAALASGNLQGATLADAFPSLDSPPLGDLVVTVPQVVLAARVPTPTASPAATETPTPCVGACHGESIVTVDDLLAMVNIALGNTPTATCRAGDANGDGQISIDEILAAVSNALNGCGVPPPDGLGASSP